MTKARGSEQLTVWMIAVRQQASRILIESERDDSPRRDMWGVYADAYLYGLALHQYRQAALLVAGYLSHDAGAALVDSFDQAMPGIKELRDVIAHFDEYATGAGRNQRAISEPKYSFIFGYSEGDAEILVTIEKFAAFKRIPVKESRDAALQLYRQITAALHAELSPLTDHDEEWPNEHLVRAVNLGKP